MQQSESECNAGNEAANSILQLLKQVHVSDKASKPVSIPEAVIYAEKPARKCSVAKTNKVAQSARRGSGTDRLIPRRPRSNSSESISGRAYLARGRRASYTSTSRSERSSLRATPVRSQKKRRSVVLLLPDPMCTCSEIKESWTKLQKRHQYSAQVGKWLRKHGKPVYRKMSAGEREMYISVFNLLDEDGSGSLDIDELVVATQLIGQRINRKALSEMVHTISGRDELDFPEFLQLVKNGRWVTESNCDHRVSDNRLALQETLKEHKKTRILSEKLPSQLEEKKDSPAASSLPFHLFIPAFCRRKNVEFVMEMKLDDFNTLPYLIENISFEKKEEVIRLLLKDRMARLEVCPCNKTASSFLRIKQMLQDRNKNTTN
mmetsp:Transcript_19206/g.31988  ORF Transcript_19206/g.31988 Transcript_19206/m.31988 type:complete len:376 (-) Transcript_19206:348-1475(-)